MRVEIHLEPSGDDGVEVGVKFPGKPLMWYDADDGFIIYENELERGNALIFGSVNSALFHAQIYIRNQLKEEGWT